MTNKRLESSDTTRAYGPAPWGLDAEATSADPTVRDVTLAADHEPRTGEATADAGENGYASHVSEIRRLYAEGEVEAALDLASLVRPSATALSLHAVPVVAVSPHEVRTLPLDARAGFLLAKIDGVSTLQTLLDVSAMTPHDAMVIVEELLALGAVRLLAQGGEL